MDALVYLFSLGFSGSDAIRAAFLLLFGALFITKRFLPWRMTLLLLAVDFVWPFVGMAMQGYDAPAIRVAVQGTLAMNEDEMVGVLVRAAGFYVFLRGTFSLRRKLHNAFPEDGSKPGLLPF